MTPPLSVIATIEEILTQHGPLTQDEIEQHARDRGADNLDLKWNLLEMDCPARQLVDERWIWLPSVLAGRVFTHRLTADELAHDVLTTAPDLNPVTALCHHEQYQRLADGSAAQPVMLDYDDELLDERDIPDEAIDEAVALLLEPGTLAALGVRDGDLIGVRLTADGLVLESLERAARRSRLRAIPRYIRRRRGVGRGTGRSVGDGCRAVREGGAFADFLRVRGSLLPDDERVLAEPWLLVDRSVFEVEKVDHGESVTVRDLRTGDVHDVRERTGSRHMKVGQVICARVVSAGDSMQFFALELVEPHERDELIELLNDEPDPVELIAALS